MSRAMGNPLPSSGQTIEGYLSEALPPASRDPDTAAFEPGRATLNLWVWVSPTPDSAPDADLEWRNLFRTQLLINMDETLTGVEDAYCLARWTGDRWQPIKVSCAASLIPSD